MVGPIVGSICYNLKYRPIQRRTSRLLPTFLPGLKVCERRGVGFAARVLPPDSPVRIAVNLWLANRWSVAHKRV
jgi:hypothetical protein